jgi:hypothetical protein
MTEDLVKRDRRHADTGLTYVKENDKSVEYGLRNCMILPYGEEASRWFITHSNYEALHQLGVKLRRRKVPFGQIGVLGVYCYPKDETTRENLSEYQGMEEQVLAEESAPRRHEIACAFRDGKFDFEIDGRNAGIDLGQSLIASGIILGKANQGGALYFRFDK